ncbi:MFS transporter, partial [Lactobacillus sp. XV13L]|nr:MFS transporter [Lactobacillus sp. XV13L]
MKQVRLKPLMLVAFLNETAYSMMWPLATIYINTVLHKSLTVAGVALFWFSVANVIGSIAIGKLYDRYNQFGLTILGMALCALICTVGIWLDGWPAYPVILAVF